MELFDNGSEESSSNYTVLLYTHRHNIWADTVPHILLGLYQRTPRCRILFRQFMPQGGFAVT